MIDTSNIGRHIGRRLRVFTVLPVLLPLLPACSDKEAPVEPALQVQLAQAREAAEHEKSQRLLSEDRLRNVVWLAVLGSGVALALGLAIGSSSPRKPEGGDGDV